MASPALLKRSRVNELTRAESATRLPDIEASFAESDPEIEAFCTVKSPFVSIFATVWLFLSFIAMSPLISI